MPAGRPSSYNAEVAADFLTEISTTRKSLQTICDSDNRFPDPKTIYRWMLANEEFRQGYARAKEDQTQILEDEILDIADNTKEGVIVTEKPDGVEIKRSDMLEHRKLQIESRKWLMMKLKPKKYGEKIQQEHSGAVGVQLVHSIPRPERD